MSDAILSDANLRGSNLSNAILHDARLHRADLTNSIVVNQQLLSASLACTRMSDGSVRAQQETCTPPTPSP